VDKLPERVSKAMVCPSEWTTVILQVRFLLEYDQFCLRDSHVMQTSLFLRDSYENLQKIEKNNFTNIGRIPDVL
jgi:hypothetical protein